MQCGRIVKYCIWQTELVLVIYGVKTVSNFLNMKRM